MTDLVPVEQDPARELVARALYAQWVVEGVLPEADVDPYTQAVRGRWLGMAQAALAALEPVLAAARSEGYAQARAEDIAALRAQANARAESGLYGDNGSCLVEAADYLASLTPTQEVPDGR